MPMPRFATARTRRFLPLLGAALFIAVLAGPPAAQAAGTPSSTGSSLVAQDTTTVSTAATDQTGGSSTTISTVPAQGTQSEHPAIVPPSTVQLPLNPGWKTDQLEIRVLPEYDQEAVLVIMNFSLPADVPLPATLKFPVPTGAQITGIGEMDPNGNYTYNYTNTYPPVEPGTDWDIASIQVKSYRDLQIDYYYDPGLPQGAGQRSFPLLVQMPMDVGTLVLHVQQPTGATNFLVDPALQGSGQASDGFTYSVATYSDVKASSTLGHIVSYYKPDGGLSIDAQQSTPTKFNTNTVLLAAILAVVVIVGALVVYRLYSNSRKAKQRGGRPRGRGKPAAAPPAGAKRQRQAGNASKAAVPKGASANAPATTKPSAAKATPPKRAATAADTETAADASTEAPTAPETGTETGGQEAAARTATGTGDKAAEYCVACGEELTPKDRFCPNCGEARR